MSARRRKSKPSQPKSTAVLERDIPQESRAVRTPQIRPGATNFQPVAFKPPSDSVINAMYTHMGPQKNTDTFYAPGAPIKPIPALLPPEGPRVLQYNAGYNIAQLPRATEQYSFADLRALASMYDGIQMCQQVWFDYVSKLELAIEPREELIDEDMDMSIFEDDILKYIEFFVEPDKELNFHDWLCKMVHEQLEIDALSIFVRKDRIGRPYSLDVLDGSMIKPLADDRGRRPVPPYPAYEQFWHGLPASLLTSDDLIYVKETQRTDSLYGRSRVERIILRVNQALRKQTKDLARFTDGNVPAGVIEVAMEVQWSQEEIEAYEIQFNNLMAGNDELRARIKVMPRGFVYKPTDDPDIHIDLDQFILTHTAACHGLTLEELAMTTTSNRSTGQSQENVVYRRAMGPLMGRYSKLLTYILRKFFKEQRFVVKLRGYEEKEDFNTMSTAYATLTAAGIQSPTQAARAMHLPVWQDVEVPPFIIPKGGQPIMIEDLANEDLHKAQVAAQLAGLQLAQSNPGGQAQSPQGEGEQGTHDDLAQSGKEGAQDGGKKPAPAQHAGNGQAKDGVHPHAGKGKAGQSTEKRVDSTEDRDDESPAVKRLMAEVAAILKRLDEAEDKRRPEVLQQHTGMMLAFMLDAKTAKQLAIPDGEPANILHITLAYLGDIEDEPGEDGLYADTLLRPNTSPEKIKQAVAMIASEAKPLTGTIGGVGRFFPAETEETPVIALVDVPSLVEFRDKLVRTVQAAGYFVANNHGYTPHITLAYIDATAPMPIESVPSLPLTLDTVTLCVGDDRKHFKLGDEQYSAYWEGKEQQTTPVASERDIVVEINKWRDKAIEDIKRNRHLRGFTTTIIPESIHTRIESALLECATVDAVREVFKQAKEEFTLQGVR